MSHDFKSPKMIKKINTEVYLYLLKICAIFHGKATKANKVKGEERPI